MTVRCLAAVLLGASALVSGVAAGSALAAPVAAPACQGSGLYSSPADVDGDSHSDLVTGVPKAMADGHYAAGVVDVHFGPEGGTRTQRVDETQFDEASARFDNFGAAVSFLTADEDPCADLAIGAPRADDGRGTVTIALGSDDGVSSTGAVTLTGRTAGEGFGSSIVAVPYRDDLWIGAPNRTVDGVKGAGAVDHYRVHDGTASLVQTLTEATPGIHGGPETGDGFGRELDVSVSGRLIVGEPAEDVGTHAKNAGTVTVVYATASSGLLTRSYTYSQNSPGIPGVAEPGDHFGTSVASTPTQVVVGVPGEALGTQQGAGSVVSFFVYFRSPKAQNVTALSQNSRGVPGADEAYDRFGKQVVNDSGGMCIGVPGESIGRVQNSGDVLCIGRHEDDQSRWDVLQLGTGPLGGRAHVGAGFGTTLSTLPYTNRGADEESDGYVGGEDLLVSAPGVIVAHKVEAGQVRIESRTAVHDSAGPMPGEYYGIPAFIVSQRVRQDHE